MGHFFCPTYEKKDGKRRKTYRLRQGIRPKIPQGGKEGGEGGGIQHRATGGSHQQKSPQHALCPAQQKQKASGGHGQGIQNVQRGGGAGKAASEGAQGIVDDTGAKAQQNGLGEKRKLPGGLGSHLSRKDG